MTATSTATAPGGGPPTRSVPLAVTGWGVLSPLGVGAEEFAPAWCGRRSGLRDVRGLYEGPLPVDEACVLTDFSVREHLGRKGTSFFDRTTSLTVVTCGLALEDSSLVIEEADRAEIGIVLGSTTGGVQSLCEFITETIVNDPPYLVNPVLFPYAVMNGAASSAAIWHQLKGVNATVSDGQASFLAVLKYARNQIRNGYVEAVVAGAVEEFSPHRAWAAEHLRGGRGARVPLGEGAAAFVLEPAEAVRASGRRPDAEILAVETGLFGQDIDPADGLAGCIGSALRSSGIDPAEVRMVAPSIAGSERRDAIERRGLAAALPGVPFASLPVKDLLGETYSASGALQLAAVLAEHRCDAGLDGAVSLITSVTSEGLVGAAVVRGWSRDER
ncbi:beta-ketoacyl synthase N-terminal-like domain-containing protein [Kitasatospora sp. NPDC003701]